MTKTLRWTLPLLGMIAMATAAPAKADTELRFLSQFVPTQKHFPNEKASLDAVAADQALGINVTTNEYKSLGLKTSDGLRLVRAGTFDVVTVQIGTASRDDPFLEGLDLSAPFEGEVEGAGEDELIAASAAIHRHLLAKRRALDTSASTRRGWVERHRRLLSPYPPHRGDA